MNREVFQHLYEQYHADVFHFLIYLVGNRSVAEDLSHEVYIRVLRAYAQFEGRSSEKTWLFSIAKNVAIDHFRKKGVRDKYRSDAFDFERDELVALAPLPEEIVALNDEMQQLFIALQQCTPDQKSVISLRFLQEMSIAETAAIMDWTESKVKTTQHRAIQRLKQLLKAEQRGEEHV